MIPGGDIDRTIGEILEHPDFAAARDTPGTETEAVGELFDSLLRAVEAFAGELRADHPEVFALVLLFALCVIAVAIWVGARGLARHAAWGAESVLPEATSSYDADPRKLRAHADDRAAKGDYLTAVRLLFRAAIIERALCEGSLTRTADAAAFRQARTYRELTQEFARTGEEVAELDRLAHRLEAGVYGGAEMVAADWARARALLARISHQVTS